jgi:single-strand DNA-binding protein
MRASSPVTAHIAIGRKVAIMSLGETHVTVQGWVGSKPEFKQIGGKTAHVSFRIGSTPRQFDRGTGLYVDKPTTWFHVECWRHLAQNAFDSVQVGQPILVSGRLRTQEWTDESGAKRSRVVLEAFSLGHDLTRGTATFTKIAFGAAATISAGAVETSASPFPAEEYVATTLPLTAHAEVPAAEAA